MKRLKRTACHMSSETLWLAADAPAAGRSARLGSAADVRERVAGGQGLRGNSGHAAICHAGAPHWHHCACAAACQGQQVSASGSQNDMSCMLDQTTVPLPAALLVSDLALQLWCIEAKKVYSMPVWHPQDFGMPLTFSPYSQG